MEMIYPLICMSLEYDDVLNDVELVLDAYGSLKGVNVRGSFFPIRP